MNNPIPFEPFNQENREIEEGSKQDKSVKYYFVKAMSVTYITTNPEDDPSLKIREIPFSDYMVLRKYIQEID